MKTRNSISMLAAAAAIGLPAIANAQSISNGSFETIAAPGGFLWEDWLNFGNANLNDTIVPPFDGFLAAKTFGAFFYQFPFGLDGLPADFPVGDLPASAVPYDSLPTNNTVVFQVIGEDDGVDESFVGQCLRATVRYYQADTSKLPVEEQLDAAANLPQFSMNFRDAPFPADPVASFATPITIATNANDTWTEYTVEGIAPAGTDFAEVLLLHFQFGTDFTVFDGDNDGVQDIINGTPVFTDIAWGTGAVHWDLVSLEVVEGGCGQDECVADFNGDMSVNVLDVIAFITAWQGGLDFNEDGMVNILDVISFINTWNAGCP